MSTRSSKQRQPPFLPPVYCDRCLCTPIVYRLQSLKRAFEIGGVYEMCLERVGTACQTHFFSFDLEESNTITHADL